MSIMCMTPRSFQLCLCNPRPFHPCSSPVRLRVIMERLEKFEVFCLKIAHAQAKLWP